MSTENPSGMLAEAMPQPAPHTPETPKRQRLAKTALLVGVVALLGNSLAYGSSHESSRSPMNVGFVEPEIFTTDAAQAQRVAEQIKAVGGNSVRFTVNVNHYQTVPTEIDKESFCNAMVAAEKDDLEPIITFQGYDTVNDKPERGFVPTTGPDIHNFISVAEAYERLAAGPTAENTPPNHIARCAKLLKPIKKFGMEIFNEWNLNSFVTQTFVNGKWMNPQEQVDILSLAMPALKTKARQLGASVEIWAGGLADDHNVLLFIKQMGIAIKKLHLKVGRKLFDVFSWHPYVPEEDVAQSHPDGYKIGISDTQMMEQTAYQAFGYVPKFMASEFGIQTSEPAGKYGYSTSTKGLDAPSFYETEQQQAQQYNEALGILACDPNIKGLLFFHLVDVGNPKSPWGHSGVLRADGTTPKAAYNTLPPTMKAAAKGDLGDCAGAPQYDRVAPAHKSQAKDYQSSKPPARQHLRSYGGPH